MPKTLTNRRKIIVHIATSADGYIARLDDDIEWLTSRPAPKGFYGIIGSFAKRVRAQKGKDIWMMGGGGIIASFLDEGAIDRFIISIMPVFIGEGIPLIARRHREVPLHLGAVERFPDGVVQVHYDVENTAT